MWSEMFECIHNFLNGALFLLISEQDPALYLSFLITSHKSITQTTSTFTTQEPDIKMLMRADPPAVMQQSLPDGGRCCRMRNGITSGLHKSHGSLLRAPTYSIQRQKMTIKQIYYQGELSLLHSTAPATLIYIHLTRSREILDLNTPTAGNFKKMNQRHINFYFYFFSTVKTHKHATRSSQ